MRYFILVTVLAATFAACSGLGSPCRDSGSKDECGPGEICTRVDGDNYCQPICDDGGDCGAGEHCRGVHDSHERACVPDDDYDDDGPIDDDNGPPL